MNMPQTQDLIVRVIPLRHQAAAELSHQTYRVFCGANPAQVTEAERRWDSCGELDSAAGICVHSDRHIAIINAVLNYEAKSGAVGETVVID